MENFSFMPNFDGREDLKKYGSNALLLYTLQLKYSIDDIDSVATNCLIDKADDKKIDLVYIDEEFEQVVIAQAYFSKNIRSEAPANKASDLNTALAWLFERNLEELPKTIISVAKELREKIKEGKVKKINIWYSHNLPESKNVDNELKTAASLLKTILDKKFTTNKIEVSYLEAGLNTIEDIYTNLTTPILVSDKLKIGKCNGFFQKNANWESFTTALPANFFYELYKKYQTKLFSANVRDYLGSRKTDSNINNGIMTTAQNEPDNFFVYNNGVTVIVNEISYNKYSKNLTVVGFSIVNGAQTTGAIGSLPYSPSKELLIPVRFIKCSQVDTIASIVKYNNSQNQINAPDFRSNDVCQKRLQKEFENLGFIYLSRRGDIKNSPKRREVILSTTAGQILAAFHGEPNTAYNEKRKIWYSDTIYPLYFNEKTTAEHIFLCYSLQKAIEEVKLELIEGQECNSLLAENETFLNFLRTRGALILLQTAIADNMENFTGKKITSAFSIKFKRKISLPEAILLWRKIIDIVKSFTSKLSEGLQDGIQNNDKVEKARKEFTQVVGAVKTANKAILDDFSANICI